MPASTTDQALIDAARRARAHAHAPISRYRVGAAIRTVEGEVYAGANVEHIVLHETCCAEKTALYAAVGQGERKFEAVAVVTDSSPPAAPCGSCRQILHYWGVDRVLMANEQGEHEEHALRDLLPLGFELEGFGGD